MTLFVFEGPSRSGKSTIRDKLFEVNPDWVKWKGENLMRKGMSEYWIDYQRRYHESLHRLYELNPENIIVADRAFSDAVYNADPQIREEMRRLIACYGDAYIVYFYPGDFDDDAGHGAAGMERLARRGSRDMYHMNEILGRYRKLLTMFPHLHVNTHELDIKASTERVHTWIHETHANAPHNPDI